MTDMNLPEKRQGKTGIWTFTLIQPDGKVLALSEWGTQYSFTRKEWEGLPVIATAAENTLP